MTLKVLRLGFIGLNCVRLEESERYYSSVLGLPVISKADQGIYFGCGFGSHALSLHAAAAPGLRHLGLQLAGTGALDDAVAALRAAGVTGHIKAAPVHGIASAIEVLDPDGHRLYLYREETASVPHFPTHGISPQKLGHVALFVQDAKRSETFYTETFGFRMSDWIDDVFVFLRCNTDHHTVNFLSGAKPGLFHVAFELSDASAFVRSCDQLGGEKIRIAWGPGRHGPGHNLYTYHRDPDGNIIELFTELDSMSSESLGYFDPRPYHRDVPQRPKVWSFSPEIDIWGAPPPPDFVPGGT